MARFQVSDEQVAAMRGAIEAESFFTIPPEVSPPQRMFHQPDLHLDIWLGARHHKVQLYDPKKLEKDDGRVRRFLAVWASVFKPLPLKPSW